MYEVGVAIPLRCMKCNNATERLIHVYVLTYLRFYQINMSRVFVLIGGRSAWTRWWEVLQISSSRSPHRTTRHTSCTCLTEVMCSTSTAISSRSTPDRPKTAHVPPGELRAPNAIHSESCQRFLLSHSTPRFNEVLSVDTALLLLVRVRPSVRPS